MNTKVLLPFLITTLLISGASIPEIGRAEFPIQVAQSITPKENYLQKSIQGFFNSFRLAGGGTGTVSPGGSTGTVSSPPSDLNAQLRQAVCRQNWSQAITVINRMIGLIDEPDVRQQLLTYKQKLQGFANSDSVVPPSELPDCSP